MSVSIIDFLDDSELLQPFFQGSSWARWIAILKAAFGLRLSRHELDLFHEVAGDRPPPKRPVRTLVCAAGRGAGKDAIASAVAVFQAATVDKSRLRPGEKASVIVVACDRDQAGICFSYIRGYIENVPLLASLITRIKDDVIELSNGAAIHVVTNNFRAPRGRTICCCVLDEVAFFKSDESFSPDVEVDAAIAPGLARWPGSMKILISSVHRGQGLLYEAFSAAYGQDDPDTLAVLGTSLQFNPLLDPAVMDRELERDRERASAEYLSQWRDDLASFIGRDVVDGLIDTGVLERAPDRSLKYSAFVDESGGRNDATTLCIVHTDNQKRVIQDVMRVWRAPFSPSEVTAEKARILRQYNVTHVVGDNYGGELPPDNYRLHNIRYERCKLVKSDLYRDFLGILNSGRILMLDNERQIAELLNLERRVRCGGRESIDHPQGNFHDDAVNALAGAAVLAATKRAPMQIDDSFLRASAVKDYLKRYSYGSRQRPIDEDDNSHVIRTFRPGQFF